MTQLEAGRKTAQAQTWAERVIGGKIVAKTELARWRPMWSLDIEKPDGTIVPLIMRGWRQPVAEDEHGTRERLRMEAFFCSALQNTGVKLPKYYGYEPDGGWFLMDRISGDFLISKLGDPTLQTKIFRGYIENLAVMHKIDYKMLDLPDNIPIATSYEESIVNVMREREGSYLRCERDRPDPLFALADWWLSRHKPLPVEFFSATTGDIGADQFFFENGQFKCIFDLELAHVGDPLQDFGCMRIKNMLYSVPDVPGHIRRWHELMGRTLDRTSVSYWTLTQMISQAKYVYPNWINPDPRMIEEVVHTHAFTIVNRRGATEALAEYYDIELAPVMRPKLVINSMAKYHDWLAGQIREYHVDHVPERNKFALKCSAALADTAILCNTLGPELERENIADLANLLGVQPTSQAAGLLALHERIKRDPETRLEATIQTLYNIEARHEFLLAPIQIFCGKQHGTPLERMSY